MFGCELMWGDDEAARVQRLVEESIGDACFCKRGLRCPVLPPNVQLPDPVRRSPAAA